MLTEATNASHCPSPPQFVTPTMIEVFGRGHLFFSMCFLGVFWKRADKLCSSRLPTSDGHCGRPSWTDTASAAHAQASNQPCEVFTTPQNPAFGSPALPDMWECIEAFQQAASLDYPPKETDGEVDPDFLPSTPHPTSERCCRNEKK